MSEQRSFGERLAAQERNGGADARQRRKKAMIDALEQERTRVQRIRIICIVAWGIVLLVPLFMGGLMAASIGPASTFHLFPMGGFMVFGPLLSGLGTIAFVVAVIATGALFFRSRSVSLASIDARLRYLEELLERRDSPRE